MEALKSPVEQRVLLCNASWETYERLIVEREERRNPRFFYDRGVLEIVSPSTQHEAISRIVAQLVLMLATEMDLDMFNAGSTTFKREDFSRGFEPDECFYLGDAAGRVRGKVNIDLDADDPAPDLIFEEDITSSSLDKLPIYARLGVVEVWRYMAGGRIEILKLRGEGYEPALESTVLPPLTNGTLTRFIKEGLTTELSGWVREVRQWMRRSFAEPGV